MEKNTLENKLTIDVELTEKQNLALYYLQDRITLSVLFGGSAGSGKSYLGCLWILVSALKYPETRYLIGRNKLINLRQSTLLTFFDVCKKFKLQKNVHYDYNAQSNVIRFKNGSEIFLKDLEYQPSDPNFDSLGSSEYTYIFVDEAGELDEKCYNVLLSRLRYKYSEYNLVGKILLTANPSKNFLYREFYIKDRDGNLEPYKQFIKCLPTDNKYLNYGYIQTLEKLDFISKSRLLFGQWEYDSQYNLCNYNSIINCFKYEAESKTLLDTEQLFLTIDPSRMGADHSVLCVWKGLNVIKIVRLDKTRITELQTEVERLVEYYSIPDYNIIIDGVGVGGGLVDNLKVDHPKLIEFLAGSRPLNDELYKNLRTQCYYKLSEYINSGKIRMYVDDPILRNQIIQELESIIADKVDDDNKLSILPKDKIKKIIGRSPDISDSLSFRMYFEYKVKKYTGVYSVRTFSPRTISKGYS